MHDAASHQTIDALRQHMAEAPSAGPPPGLACPSQTSHGPCHGRTWADGPQEGAAKTWPSNARTFGPPSETLGQPGGRATFSSPMDHSMTA
ncbi:lysine-specific demethylase 5D [Dorcoceras hygrometricum]|uniref:Lysine-specific demethylase 5D n=1 Tax=Dorcoceras hygrometricum TaxID=472368 RepID=A0A2Z7B8F3_9LAMI|nr:lysine-specific demethylase 5D [Dorcoceras hygrometricum]